MCQLADIVSTFYSHERVKQQITLADSLCLVLFWLKFTIIHSDVHILSFQILSRIDVERISKWIDFMSKVKLNFTNSRQIECFIFPLAGGHQFLYIYTNAMKRHDEHTPASVPRSTPITIGFLYFVSSSMPMDRRFVLILISELLKTLDSQTFFQINQIKTDFSIYIVQTIFKSRYNIKY